MADDGDGLGVTGATGDERDVIAAARAYERALSAGDTAAAGGWFDDRAGTTRFGPDGSQLELAAVLAVRASTPALGDPTWRHEEARAVGSGVVVHLALLERGDAVVQRTQVWVRRDAGWRITHAHVSSLPLPPPR